MVADVEELEDLDASEIHARRLNAQEVLTRKNREEYIFLFADGSVNLVGKDKVFREIHFRSTMHQVRNTSTFFLESRTGLNHQTNKRRTLKPETISGVFLGTVFIVITFNQELNSLCQKRDHSQYHSNINVVSRTNTTLDVLLESCIDS